MTYLSLGAKQRIFKCLALVGLEVAPTGLLFGRGIRRRDTFGRDPWRDVREILGGCPRTVIDVGAHIGQTAIELRRHFPDAEIVSFEPDPDNFAQLSANTRTDHKVHRVQAAVGAGTGSADLHRNAGSQTHSLLAVARSATDYVSDHDVLRPEGVVTVDVTALDDFCRERALFDRVDVLKADAQGYEIEVLKGAGGLLTRPSPPLLFLEVSFVHQYASQPLFHDVAQYVGERGYQLVALYDIGYSTHYCAVGANALFVHKSMARRRS